MANAPAKSRNVEAQAANPRQEATETVAKKPGRPSTNGTKPVEKIEYPAKGKLSAIPEDYNPELHKRLRKSVWVADKTDELQKQFNERFPKDRNYFPALCGADGKYNKDNKISTDDPNLANLDISIEFGYSLDGVDLVGLKPSQFADRRTLAKLLVPVLETKIASLNKLAKMTDEQLAAHTKRENLQSVIGKKATLVNGKITSKEDLEAILSMLPQELQDKLAAASN